MCIFIHILQIPNLLQFQHTFSSGFWPEIAKQKNHFFLVKLAKSYLTHSRNKEELRLSLLRLNGQCLHTPYKLHWSGQITMHNATVFAFGKHIARHGARSLSNARVSMLSQEHIRQTFLLYLTVSHPHTVLGRIFTLKHH